MAAPWSHLALFLFFCFTSTSLLQTTAAAASLGLTKLPQSIDQLLASRDVRAPHTFAASAKRQAGAPSMLVRRVNLSSSLRLALHDSGENVRPLPDDKITFANDAFDHYSDEMKKHIEAHKKIIRQQVNKARQRPGQDGMIQSYHVIKAWHRPRPDGASVILGQGKHGSGVNYDGATVIPWQHDKKAEVRFSKDVEHASPESIPLERKVMTSAVHDYLQWHPQVRHYEVREGFVTSGPVGKGVPTLTGKAYDANNNEIKDHQVIPILRQHWPPAPAAPRPSSAWSTWHGTSQQPITPRSKSSTSFANADSSDRPSRSKRLSATSTSPKFDRQKDARRRLFGRISDAHRAAKEEAALQLQRNHDMWQKSLGRNSNAYRSAKEDVVLQSQRNHDARYKSRGGISDAHRAAREQAMLQLQRDRDAWQKSLGNIDDLGVHGREQEWRKGGERSDHREEEEVQHSPSYPYTAPPNSPSGETRTPSSSAFSSTNARLTGASKERQTIESSRTSTVGPARASPSGDEAESKRLESTSTSHPSGSSGGGGNNSSNSSNSSSNNGGNSAP